MGLLDALEALDDLLGDDEEFNPDFTLVNDTRYDFHEVYVSPSDSDDWEEDILGEDILEADGRLNVDFSTNSRKRYWDIKIVDEDADESVFERFDLSRVRKITIFYDEDGEIQARYEY